MQIKGHAALVTGGASGLGLATAKALAEAGAKVAILDINTEQLERASGEAKLLPVACDVADPASAETAIKTASARHGPARILVNCAGIGVAKRIVGREGPMALADFERVIRVNLIGSFNMLRLAAHVMSQLSELEDGERGIIISTASAAAFEGQVGQAAYSASKGGIVAMTLPAAREFAQFGIRVMALAPGLFLTPLLHNLPKAVQESLAASIPFPRRLGKPEEFAALVLACVTNPALNGEVIRIDGALRLPPR
jgi:NAD(P)-dependent dehydrogenase (short-subunit alcohol dehydrogenase family)